MSHSPTYVPPSGEYIRPAKRLVLRPEGRFDNHFVRGAVFHSAAFLGLRDGQSVEIELVPEPGNPHDRWAVALHVNGTRIGYIAAGAAGEWQDFVVTCNRRGIGVFATGDVRVAGATLAATVFLPWEKELEQIAMDEEVCDQCDRLLGALSTADRERIIAVGGWGFDYEDAKVLHGVKRYAPDLNWKPNTNIHKWDSLPSQIVWRVSTINAAERQERREAREVARALKAHEFEERRESKRRAADQKHAMLVEKVPVLYLGGMSKSAITSTLQCSLGEVNRYLILTNTPSRSRPNAESRNERTARAFEAVRLQTEGMSRMEIAAVFDCSLLTVKALLRDGKFYADPESDPERLALVRAVGLPRQTGQSQDVAAARLELTPARLKAARRDCAVLAHLQIPH